MLYYYNLYTISLYFSVLLPNLLIQLSRIVIIIIIIISLIEAS
jgi:hypothetical protein